MRLLGIDYGAKRVGLALSDEGGRFAMPHDVLRNDDKLIAHIAALCQQKGVGQIVVGESKNLNGQPNPIMAAAARFAEALQSATGLPVVFEPEMFTSAEAERIQGKTTWLDASAAALILKSYIDRVSRND